MKLSISLFTIFLIFAAASFAAAQQKVVVIPLMDDAKKNLKNVVTVSPANGDYTNPADALASTQEVYNCKFIGLTGTGTYSYGVHNSCSSNLTIHNNYIKGEHKGVASDGCMMRVSQSSVAGGGLNIHATLTCTASDNGVSATVDNTCN